MRISDLWDLYWQLLGVAYYGNYHINWKFEGSGLANMKLDVCQGQMHGRPRCSRVSLKQIP